MPNYATSSIGYDTTFELNEFNEPRIRSEVETMKNVILFILMSKPGQYPSLPMIGMDIHSKLYSYYDELDVSELKSQLSAQCEMLGVYINKGAVDFKKIKYHNQPALLINIVGSESYPADYKSDQAGNYSKKYLVGLTLDELNRLIYNINEQREEE